MKIERIKIVNFKVFKGEFDLKLNEGLNILVGNNEAGKSTVLEAIHLVLTGLFNGKYLKNIATGKNPLLPYILIEVFIKGEDLPQFEGNGNSEKIKSCGISLKIAFDEKYQIEYSQLIQDGNIKSLPIEYYDISWNSFARESITSRSIPIKSALIDSSSTRYQNGSDIYISRIVRDNLEAKEIVEISQAYRTMRDSFMECPTIKAINKKIKSEANISNKNIELSVELLSKNAWENSLMTYLDEVPFHFIGKGEQCIIKTKLALSHKKSKEANQILLEEPENHLTHSRLNQLIHKIKSEHQDKQIIISTHSSFVANKLGLDNLILLNDIKPTRFNDLKPDTRNYFEKIAGYDTLRLILCKKAILVEGDSDELVLQKAYMLENSGKLPIEDEIDVISVGTSFLRFLEIAEKINKSVVVVTDNDGDIGAVHKKYENYLGDKIKPHIKICFDNTVDSGCLMLGTKPFNYNTLEPKMLKVNDLQKFNRILGTNFDRLDDFQDLAGYDLELLKLLFGSDSNILMVGDPRQVTYLTHNESKFKKYRDGKIKDFIQNECKKSNCEIDEVTLNLSFRNNEQICKFSSKLYPNFATCASNQKEVTKHDGVFLVKKQDVKKYLEAYNPVQLKDSIKVEIYQIFKTVNFGESKGLTFERVLIYPKEPFVKWLINNNFDLKPTSRSKFYVAITRARYRVGIVYDFDSLLKIEGVKFYGTTEKTQLPLMY